jgi:putative ABC transport system permease protein
VFDPLAQDPPRSVSIAMRGSGGDLGRAITSIDASVAIGDIETMWARLGRGLAYPKFRAVLLGAFAVFSVLLAAIGLYGVLGQFVAQHTREIGVRMAVGATSANVLQLVLLQAARPLVLGLTAGLLGAGALGRYVASLLYGVRPADPITFGLVSVSLIFVAGFATFLPTLRAIRVDPMETLRNE